MDSKGTITTGQLSNVLMNNDEYFKYIFKKTEKIVGAVFYVTRQLSQEIQKDILVVALEAQAQRLLDVNKKTLTLRTDGYGRELLALKVELLGLSGSLSLLVPSRIIENEVLQVFLHELNSVERSLSTYTREPSLREVLGFMSAPERSAERQVRMKAHRVLEGEGGMRPGTPREVTPSRTDRIMSIIRDKGQVSIKDLSDAITDVSEKTIQRELLSLVEKGQISKTGERRWSRYSLNT